MSRNFPEHRRRSGNIWNFTGKLTLDLTLYDMEKRKRVYSCICLHAPLARETIATNARPVLQSSTSGWIFPGKDLPLTLLTLTTLPGRWALLGSRSVATLSRRVFWDPQKRLGISSGRCFGTGYSAGSFDYLLDDGRQPDWIPSPACGQSSPNLRTGRKEKTKDSSGTIYRAGLLRTTARSFEDSCLDAKGDIKNAGFLLFKYLGKGFCIDPDRWALENSGSTRNSGNTGGVKVGCFPGVSARWWKLDFPGQVTGSGSWEAGVVDDRNGKTTFREATAETETG